MMRGNIARGCDAKEQTQVRTLGLTTHLWPTDGLKPAWYQTKWLINVDYLNCKKNYTVKIGDFETFVIWTTWISSILTDSNDS